MKGECGKMSLITNCFQLNVDNNITDIIQILVDIVGIFITAGVSIWIVKTIQKRLNNERSIKDYFIGEVSVIQNEYRNLLSSVMSSKESPKMLKVKFNNLNTKVNSLMKLLAAKYKIQENLLAEYQTQLPMIIEDDRGYTSVYRQDSRFTLTQSTMNAIYKLDRENGHLFYDIIVKINDAA